MLRKSHLFNFVGGELTDPRHLTGYILTSNEGVPEALSFLADSCIYSEMKLGQESLGTIVFGSCSEVFYLAEGNLLENLDALQSNDFKLIGNLRLNDYDKVNAETMGYFTHQEDEDDIFGFRTTPWLTSRILDLVRTRNGPIIDFERVLVQKFYGDGIMRKLQDKYRVS